MNDMGYQILEAETEEDLFNEFREKEEIVKREGFDLKIVGFSVSETDDSATIDEGDIRIFRTFFLLVQRVGIDNKER